MAVDRFEVMIGNTAIGAGNLSINTFHVQATAGPTVAQAAAQLFAFCCYGSKAVNSFIDSILWTPAGAAGAVPVAFPTAELVVLQANDAGLPAIGAYGAVFGSGDLTPIGTSITFTKYSSTPGRHATGRNYLPFIRVGAVETNGTLKAASKLDIEQAWTIYSRGIAAGGVATPPGDLQEVVNGVGGPFGLLVGKASSTFANLRSRRT